MHRWDHERWLLNSSGFRRFIRTFFILSHVFLFVFFGLILSSLCVVAENPPTYGLQGQAVIFNPGIQTPPEDILWKHNGNKVVEFNGMTQTAYGSYEGRITLDWHAADIEIGNLRYEDSGEYVVEVFHKTLKTYTYKLQVIGKFCFVFDYLFP